MILLAYVSVIRLYYNTEKFCKEQFHNFYISQHINHVTITKDFMTRANER